MDSFEFKLTHQRRDDGRSVGILPGADKGFINYSYKAPKDGGQSFRMREEEFHKVFVKLVA